MMAVFRISSLILFVYIAANVQFVSSVTNQRCPLYWTTRGNSCYRFRWVTLKTWNEAKQWCKSQGADLIKIETVGEKNWVKAVEQSLLNHNHKPNPPKWWTGLNNINPNSPQWVWDDQSPVSPSVVNVQSRLSYKSDTQHCAYLLNGTFFNSLCYQRMAYVCERPIDTPLTCDADHGWQQYNTYCYKVHLDNQNWIQAGKICSRDGGDLVQITGQTDEVILHDFAKNTGHPMWTGLKSVKLGNKALWMWTNGTTLDPSINFWNGGHPPTIGRNRYNNTCVYMSPSSNDYRHAWNVDNCNTRKGYVCRKPEGVCQQGWVPHQRRCYQFNIRTPMTWQNAANFCIRQGGTMVGIYSSSYKSFINSYLDELQKAGIPSIWIGASDNGSDTGPFSWYHGPRITFQNWAHNPPRNTRGRLDCGYINTGDRNGKWQITANCAQNKGFVCQIGMGIPVHHVTTPRPHYRCNRNWVLHGTTCYRFNDARKDWLSARKACQALGTGIDLAQITSQDVQGFIQSRARNNAYWIGLNDRTQNGRFVWLDGQQVSHYFHWKRGQPNNGGSLNCVLQTSAGWITTLCTSRVRYVCQQVAINFQLPVTQPATTALPISQKCGVNWEEDPNSNWCYQFIDKQLDWTDARQVCLQSRGDLVSIQSREEQFYLAGKVQTMNSVGVWIGANDRSSEGGWRWSDGSAFAYLNWAPGEPNSFLHHNEDCGVMFTQRSTWNDAQCNERNGFICKKASNVRTTVKRTTLPPTPAGMTLGCPNYWKKNGNSCFRIIRNNMNWDQAQLLCRRNGGFLASIRSRTEQNFMMTLLPKGTGFTGVWIGLNDKQVDMRFQWTDGSPVTYTHWGPNEPNNYRNRDEDCVQVYLANGNWNDYVCSNTAVGALCRRPVGIVSATKAPESVGCNLPARGYGPYCYQLVAANTVTKNWQDAQNDCVRHFHGNLATINDRYVQAFISTYILYQNDYFWIGLSDTQVQGTYKWSGNTPVKFTYWHNTHTGNEVASCVAMRGTAPVGLWENKNCTEKHHYVCQFRRAHYTLPVTTPVPMTATCAPGYQGFHGFCYKAYVTTDRSKMSTWDEAKYFCQSLGADLASIHSKAENDFVTGSVINGTNSGFWIGLNDRANEAGYVWTDQSGTDFTNWNRGEPNNYQDSEDCVQMLSTSGKWNDNSCYLSMNYICKVASGVQLATSVAPPTAQTSVACGTGWLAYNNFCYWIGSNGTLSWYDARTMCQGIGSELASFHNQDESNMILAQLGKASGGSFWIGLNELENNGRYVWSDNTFTDFTNWRKGEPNDAFGGERCVNMDSHGGNWNDQNCNDKLAYVCKKSASGHGPITPAPKPLINGGCQTPAFKAVPFSNKCFFVTTTSFNWTASRDFCRTSYPGSDIASIATITEQDFLISMIKNSTYSVWIGLKKLRGNNFEWQDNSPFTFQNWGKGEPNSAPSGTFTKNSENCVEMYTRYINHGLPGEWNDKGCFNNRPVVCQQTRQLGLPIASVQGPCGLGYTSFSGSCYKYFSAGQPYTTAQSICNQNGGYLTNLVDIYEDSFVQSLVGNSAPNGFWIGLSDQQVKGTYVWSRGWPVSYTNWGSGEPTRGTGEGCVAIKNNVWNDTNCAQSLGFICEINKRTPPPTTVPSNAYCADPTYTILGDYCYYFSRYKTASWPEASYYCTKLGMTLVSVHSIAEVTFIVQKFTGMVPYANETATPTPPNVWLGLNKGLTDGFTWIDGTGTNFLNWDTNEPSDPLTASNEECVEMYANSGKWNDVSCFTNRKYVCKGKALQPTTPFSLPPITGNLASNPVIQGPTAPYHPNTPKPVTPYTYNPNTPKPNTPYNPIFPNRNPTTLFPVVRYSSTLAGPQQPQAQRSSGSNSVGNLSTGGLVGILLAVIIIVAIVCITVIFVRRRQDGVGGGAGVGGFENALYSKSENAVDIDKQPGKANNGYSFDDDADA